MQQFLILTDDYIDDDALNRRLDKRETHLQRVCAEKKVRNFVIGRVKLNNKTICMAQC
jgi:hypothetical protein